MKAQRSLRVYEWCATREPTSSLFATAWPSLPRPTMWDYLKELEFRHPDIPFIPCKPIFTAGREKVDSRGETPSAMRSSCPRCYTGKSLSQSPQDVVTNHPVTVISQKSTVANILHPDRPSWMSSITFPPREEPWHTQVANKIIVQVLLVLAIPISMSVGEPNTPQSTSTSLLINFNDAGHYEGNLKPTLTQSAPPSQGSVWRTYLTKRSWPRCFQGNQFFNSTKLTRFFVQA